MATSVKGKNGEAVAGKEEMQYSEGMLNVFKDWVADVGCLGQGGM